jgi:serine/threonine protein kinase
MHSKRLHTAVFDLSVFSNVNSKILQIGIGTFSVVHECKHVVTNETFAVKRLLRKDLHPSDAVALHDEIAALRLVTECDHIVKLYDVYDEPDDTYLVLECMGGGDLIDRIIEKRHYTEYDAKEVSRKLILGVEYCHKKKIANRNLKPENLLLVSHPMLHFVCLFVCVPLSSFHYFHFCSRPVATLRSRLVTLAMPKQSLSLIHCGHNAVQKDMWHRRFSSIDPLTTPLVICGVLV